MHLFNDSAAILCVSDVFQATRQAEAQRWAHADFVDRPADAAQLKEERNRLAVWRRMVDRWSPLKSFFVISDSVWEYVRSSCKLVT